MMLMIISKIILFFWYLNEEYFWDFNIIFFVKVLIFVVFRKEMVFVIFRGLFIDFVVKIKYGRFIVRIIF